MHEYFNFVFKINVNYYVYNYKIYHGKKGTKSLGMIVDGIQFEMVHSVYGKSMY